MKLPHIFKSIISFFKNDYVAYKRELDFYGVKNQKELNKVRRPSSPEAFVKRFTPHVNGETITEISIIVTLTYSDENYTKIKASIIDESFKGNFDYPWSIMTDLLEFYQVITDRNIYAIADVNPFDLYLNNETLWVYKLHQKITSEDQVQIFPDLDPLLLTRIKA